MRKAFRVFRIIALLTIFIVLAFYAKTQKLKSRAWSTPLEVVIYPMNNDNSLIVDDYISQLNDSTFTEIDSFFKNEAEHYSLSIAHPTQTHLGQTLDNLPPISPHPDSSFSKIAWWGLKFRYWAYKNTPDDESNLRRIRIFVLYHQAEENKQLQHSLGLDKGLLAMIHAFAHTDYQQQNNIVIAHELLHTVGATDKYNRNNQPVFPDGYADPGQQPLFPQSQAEIMSAKIPTSYGHSKMAESLSQCLIGEKTALEINWLQNNLNE